jgi:hypothetical protein
MRKPQTRLRYITFDVADATMRPRLARKASSAASAALGVPDQQCDAAIGLLQQVWNESRSETTCRARYEDVPSGQFSHMYSMRCTGIAAGGLLVPSVSGEDSQVSQHQRSALQADSPTRE